MATVQSTMRLMDAMSGPIKNITNGMNLMISTMYKMQDATNRNTNIDKALNAAKQQIASAEAEINKQINMAKQSQDKFKNSVDKSKSSVANLSFAVIALNQGLELARKTWGTINSSMGLADEMTATNARLALVNDGLRTNAELQQQVLDVANRTRQGYVETAGLVTKLGAGTQGIFKNDDELLKFTEQFNKSLVISGATAIESSSAILQMSQALGSGLLQGDELRSLSETAPVMMRILSDGLGIARGELKQMGADGELTADKIVKAFQNQSDQIEAMFKEMPMTFGGAMTILTNHFKNWYASLNEADGPLTNITEKVIQLTAYLQSEDGINLMNSLAEGVSLAVDWLIKLVEFATQVYTFFYTNWPQISPIVYGIVGAFMALRAIMVLTAISQGVAAAATVIQTLVTFAQTVATLGLATAWKALNAAMKANVIILIVSLIITLAVWLINLWNTNDNFVAGFMRAWNKVLGFFDQIPIFFTKVGNGIANAFDDAKVVSLQIMQLLVNGVIDDINKLIGMLNKIPGVSINAIGHVEFAASTAAEAEARKQARAAKVTAMEQDALAKAAEREAKVEKMLNDRAAKREKEQAGKDEKLNAGTGSGTSLFSPNGGPTSVDKIDKVNKVGKIEDKVDISSEDLKTMRELAEMKSIQNFVTLTPTVSVTTGPVTQGADIDTIVARIEQTLEEEIASAAAGVYA